MLRLVARGVHEESSRQCVRRVGGDLSMVPADLVMLSEVGQNEKRMRWIKDAISIDGKRLCV